MAAFGLPEDAGGTSLPAQAPRLGRLQERKGEASDSLPLLTEPLNMMG